MVTSSAVVGSSAISSLRVAGQGDGDHHALAHAAAELVRVVVARVWLGRRNAHQLQHLDRAVHGFLAAGSPSCRRSALGDLLADAVDRVQRSSSVPGRRWRFPWRGSSASRLGRQRHQVAAFPQHLAGDDACPGGIVDELHHCLRGDALAAARLSPTTHSGLAGIDVRGSTPSTACSQPSSVLKWVFRPLISSSAMYNRRVLRVQRVAQTVADEVDRQHRQEDGQAREQRPVGGDVEVVLGCRTGCGPRWECRAGSPGPGTLSVAFCQDGRSDIDGAGHDHRPQAELGRMWRQHLCAACWHPGHARLRRIPSRAG